MGVWNQTHKIHFKNKHIEAVWYLQNSDRISISIKVETLALDT